VQEQQLKDRESELAEALAALENSRKALEGAASFVQVQSIKPKHKGIHLCVPSVGTHQSLSVSVA